VGTKLSNQTIHFSRLGSLQPIISYFERQGLPVQEYLQQVGISDELMANPEKPIPKSLHWKFVTTVCPYDDVDHIGLLVGSEASLEDLGEVGEFLLASDSVSEYLLKGARYINTLSSGEYYWLVDEVDNCRFCISISGLQEDHATQNYIYTLLITINTIRKAVGDSWCPTELNVPAIKAVSAARLAEHFPNTKISRRGDYASILIPSAVLEKPLVKNSNPSALPQENLPQNFKSSVISIIEMLIFSSRPELKKAVNISGLSSRTFQRNLEKMGVSYSQLVLETRMGLARQWLDNGDLEIGDISKALGYKNSSNFSRAFLGLVGQSPRDYRNRKD